MNVAAEGASQQLDFYWAVDGSSTWHREQIAGTDTTYSAPSMTNDSTDVNVAARGTGQSLWFYWAVNGSPTWHGEPV